MAQFSIINENSIYVAVEEAARALGIDRVLLAFSYDGKVLANSSNSVTMHALEMMFPRPVSAQSERTLRQIVDAIMHD
jgi:hypothetical protein